MGNSGIVLVFISVSMYIFVCIVGLQHALETIYMQNAIFDRVLRERSVCISVAKKVLASRSSLPYHEAVTCRGVSGGDIWVMQTEQAVVAALYYSDQCVCAVCI